MTCLAQELGLVTLSIITKAGYRILSTLNILVREPGVDPPPISCTLFSPIYSERVISKQSQKKVKSKKNDTLSGVMAP